MNYKEVIKIIDNNQFTEYELQHIIAKCQTKIKQLVEPITPDYEITFQGDFNKLTKIGYGNLVNGIDEVELELLYEELREYFDTYEECPDPIKFKNTNINGELWDFTLKVTRTRPAEDFSCYGNWYVQELEIINKIKY